MRNPAKTGELEKCIISKTIGKEGKEDNDWATIAALLPVRTNIQCQGR
jgi:hypothetical protein